MTRPTGNPRGRRPRLAETNFLDATTQRITVEDWNVIIDQVVRKARKGDMWAIQFLANYLIGKPTDRVDVNQSGKTIVEVRYVDDPLKTRRTTYVTPLPADDLEE